MNGQLDLLTSQEVAEMLRVPVTTVYRWREMRTGPRGARVGKHVLYNRADVEAWWQMRLAKERRS